MKYLFGDGTESELSLNYLEYLRGALLFSSSVLKGDTIIAEQEVSAAKAREKAEVDFAEIDHIEKHLDSALEKLGNEVKVDEAQNCIAQLKAVSLGEVERSRGAIQARTNAVLDVVSSTITEARSANEIYLEQLMLRHDLPESRSWVNATVDSDGTFNAELSGQSGVGVSFSIDLSIPSENLLSGTLRVERVDPELTIQVPRSGGWGRKDGKLKTVKLAKDYVVAVRNIGDELMIQTRNAPVDGHSGLDITFVGDRVQLIQVVKQEALEPIAADDEDAAKLVRLRVQIETALSQLVKSRRALREILFHDVPLCEHVEPSKLVRELVARMIPVVRQIKRHSLAPGELVLKKVLSDDRREEVFASMADLAKIVSDLPKDKREIFAPLGLTGPVEDSHIDDDLGDLKIEQLDDSQAEVDDFGIELDGTILVEESVTEGSHKDMADSQDEDARSPSVIPPPRRFGTSPPPRPNRPSLPRPSTVPPAPKPEPQIPIGLPSPRKE